MKKFGIIVMVMMLLMSTMVFADGLTLVSASLENGTKDVSVEPEFIFDFSNNVVNMTVKDNNMTMFELIDEEGELVPLLVEMGDDQVDREIRNTIIVRPESPLMEGSIYSLTIKQDLMSKNQNTLGEDIVIHFTTEGEKEAEPGMFTNAGMALAMVVLGAVIGYRMRKRKK